MVMVKRMRYSILKLWYPEDVKSISDYVHKACLASLGLHPLVDNNIQLTTAIGPEITARIAAIATTMPEEKAPRALSQSICNRLIHDYDITSEDEKSELRWNVSHWVTINLADGRGGVSASKDAANDTMYILQSLAPVLSDEQRMKCRVFTDRRVTTPKLNPEESATEPIIVRPSPVDPWCCDRCLKSKADQGLKPHTNVNAKRAHRKWIIDYLNKHPARQPALFYLDDKLPSDDGPDRYFTEDLLAAPALRGKVKVHQFFSPNLKASVVEDLQRLGVLHTQQTCACLFLQRYAPVIRDHYGGLAVAFLDVWGSFQRGAKPLVEISVSLRLLNPRGCMVTFAASDRSARAKGQTSVGTFAAVQCEAQSAFQQCGYQIQMLSAPEGAPVAYNTMQIHAWNVLRL
jgi:hypothetical protein